MPPMAFDHNVGEWNAGVIGRSKAVPLDHPARAIFTSVQPSVGDNVIEIAVVLVRFIAARPQSGSETAPDGAGHAGLTTVTVASSSG